MKRALILLSGVVVAGLVAPACSSSSSSVNGADASTTDDGGGSNDSGGTSNDGGGTSDSSTASDTGSNPDGGGGVSPMIGGCPVFPPNDAWNTPVTTAMVDASWTTKLFANATNKAAHPDFGSNFGIPFNVVPANQTPLTMDFVNPGESDLGPYPFPGSTALIEGGTPASCAGDCHVLTIQQGACEVYEADACSFNAGTSTWSCYSGAKWDMTKLQEGQRTAGFTSADAAGLSITAGLVRYDEVAAGVIHHAIRFTMHCTQDGYVSPASHQAVPNQCPPGISQANLRDQYPPMGTRIRLKSTFSTTGLSQQAKVVAVAMQTYGLILADNGSDYYFQGEPNAGFDDNQLDDLKGIGGDQFEVLTMPAIQH